MLEQIKHFEGLLSKLKDANPLSSKIQILNEQPSVFEFYPRLLPYLTHLSEQQEFAIKSLLAIGQGPVVFRKLDQLKDAGRLIQKLMDILLQIEAEYQSLGGIIGYHLTILQFIVQKKEPPKRSSEVQYYKPKGTDLSKPSPEIHRYVEWGIESLPLIGEIYPVGGAGDRLGLVDKHTGKPMPAAKLKFLGKSLLEGLFRDLQAREFLYYQLKGKQIVTPVALMTSHEKDNHRQIVELCEENGWFGRPKESIRFFTQSLVPVVAIDGQWSTTAPLELTLKPGGHGFLWLLALKAGIFDWMEAQHKRKLLIRQINNPVAGIDQGLLAFLGIGCHEDKAFGFASCPRLLNTHEGMNVLVKRKVGDGYEYCLTNIEYTEFAQMGIPDVPEEPESRYSAFPSNTNILFADIGKVRQAAELCPIPGLIINMKNKVPSVDSAGNSIQIEGGRLESTMQNIADVIVGPDDFDHLPSYITFNTRRKTISVTKALYEQGKNSLGTPEECLFDLLANYEELLRDFCRFHLPPLGTKEEYLKNGPPFLVMLHPALGPPFETIAQKIQHGTIEKNGEMQLEIAHLEITHLHLKGSLRVLGENILGKKNGDGSILYGQETSKCILRHVKVNNAGIDRKATQCYWANEIARKEELCITIEGNGEFIAENIEFNGNIRINVPAGYRVRAIQEGKNVRLEKEEIEAIRT